MNLCGIDNLNIKQILEIYKDVLEGPEKLAYEPCWDGTEGPCK